MTPSNIPQADPRAGYLARRPQIDAAIARVLQGGTYILGPEVAAFEEAFAKFVGVDHAVGVASGTDALVLGLKALGVGAGDIVATVSHTAIATVAAIELAGAAPLLVDVEPEGFTMDPQALEAALAASPRLVKAVVPVHLYGEPAAMDQIMAAAARHGACVLEDGAQAHGAATGQRQVGASGAAGAFSLYPTKNLGALGDAGIVATSDAELAERLRALRQYGWGRARISEMSGMNSRLDELQAAVLRVKLDHLHEDNARRRAIARAYDDGLNGLDLVRPSPRPDATHVYHQYVVRLADRDRVREVLAAQGVGTAIHYPAPAHRQPAYADRVLVGPTGLAATERLSSTILSLPMFPELEDRAVQRVIEALRDALG
jgi:dTDP-4-amino-4,6-dideoxygalactose transaminase